MIGLSTGEVSATPATWKYILLDSDFNIWMQYVVSDPDPDVGNGTRETMSITLTASEKRGGCGPRLTC